MSKKTEQKDCNAADKGYKVNIIFVGTSGQSVAAIKEMLISSYVRNVMIKGNSANIS